MLRAGLHSGRRFVIVVDNYYDGDVGGSDGDGGGGEGGDDDNGAADGDGGAEGGNDASICRIKTSRA